MSDLIAYGKADELLEVAADLLDRAGISAADIEHARNKLRVQLVADIKEEGRGVE